MLFLREKPYWDAESGCSSVKNVFFFYFFFFHDEDGKLLKQVCQSRCGCPNTGRVQGQDGWVFDQTDWSGRCPCSWQGHIFKGLFQLKPFYDFRIQMSYFIPRNEDGWTGFRGLVTETFLYNICIQIYPNILHCFWKN